MESKVLTESEIESINLYIDGVAYKKQLEENSNNPRSPRKVEVAEFERELFIDICKEYLIIPARREVHADFRFVTKQNRFSLLPIISYEVYLKRAERTGKLDGWRAWVVKKNNEEIAYLEINRKDWSKPFIHEVFANEVKISGVGQGMRRFMLKKVAISQGFRMCFPDELGGMPYTSDELPAEQESYAPQTPKADQPKKPNPEQNQTDAFKSFRERLEVKAQNDKYFTLFLIDQSFILPEQTPADMSDENCSQFMKIKGVDFEKNYDDFKKRNGFVEASELESNQDDDRSTEAGQEQVETESADETSTEEKEAETPTEIVQEIEEESNTEEGEEDLVLDDSRQPLEFDEEEPQSTPKKEV